jgi:hypothetical protein
MVTRSTVIESLDIGSCVSLLLLPTQCPTSNAARARSDPTSPTLSQRIAKHREMPTDFSRAHAIYVARTALRARFLGSRRSSGGGKPLVNPEVFFLRHFRCKGSGFPSPKVSWIGCASRCNFCDVRDRPAKDRRPAPRRSSLKVQEQLTMVSSCPRFDIADTFG